MRKPYRVVNLIKNQLYPTYQLHAYLSNKKTTPQDGLRLGALLTLDWLCRRLGADLPEELAHVPDPSAYRSVQNDCLVSFHQNSGYVIDIVSLPEEGIWTLQITEPDLGSDPGHPDQARPAVPGRVFETNIGFHIVGNQLECGFQTIVSDPEGTPTPAEVYRLAVVRQLIDHPDFGLRQITPLRHEVTEITTVEQLKQLTDLWKNQENTLPCVVFTQVRSAPKMPKTMPDLPSILPYATLEQQLFQAAPPLPAAPTSENPPYDIETFSKYGVTLCRTYLLSDGLLDRFSERIGQTLLPGDIICLEPTAYDGTVTRYPLKPNKGRQEETMAALTAKMYSYPRGKSIDFGSIVFLSAAREDLLHRTQITMQESKDSEGQWKQTILQLEQEWNAALDQKEKQLSDLRDQLSRQKAYQAQQEQLKEETRQKHQDSIASLQQQLRTKDEDIAYWKRKLSQPKEHTQIAPWVQANFSDRLLLHSKAVSLLEDKSAREIDIALICDALDFLATDYWDCRYQRISKEERNNRCSEKYGRPFTIKPIGFSTVQYTPVQYKIKYFRNAQGKLYESPLEYHLCVGNDPENLLRIYFLHDDTQQKIVVGSLPRHLKTVTIQ